MIDDTTPIAIGTVDRLFPGAGSKAARLAWGKNPRPTMNEPDFRPTDKLQLRHFVRLAGIPRSDLIRKLTAEHLARLARG
jgi:hypothetical protein